MSLKSDGITLAVVGIGVYLVYQYIKKNGVPNPLAPVGTAVGGALYNALNPGAAGASTTYIATAPDGSKVAVNNNSLDPFNNFSYGGQTYNLSQNAAGQNIATPVDTTDTLIDFTNAGNF
jgi:hypothetical protein